MQFWNSQMQFFKRFISIVELNFCKKKRGGYIIYCAEGTASTNHSLFYLIITKNTIVNIVKDNIWEPGGFAQKYTKTHLISQTLLLTVVGHCTQKINLNTLILKRFKANSFQGPVSGCLNFLITHFLLMALWVLIYYFTSQFCL